METLHETETDTIIDRHLEGFVNNDLDLLTADYSENCELWKSDGLFKGKEAIAAFYSYVFNVLPKENTELHLIHRIVKGNKAYLAWSAESAFISIPLGTDSFEMQNGKIVWQSIAAHIVPKS